MGIDFTALRTLFLLRRLKLADFSRTVTLGRHEIFFNQAEFDYVSSRSGIKLPYKCDVSDFQEPLLELFGAQKPASIDASDYEGATIICDFNRPVPAELDNQFSLYLDFGSIEHIFNIPQVILNINRLLCVRGAAVICTNATGSGGHGLYQFSPEFFFSSFSETNGFTNARVFLIDEGRPKVWKSVVSPLVLKRRNYLPYDKRLFVLCLAEKMRTVDSVFAQQSDYENVAWKDKGHHHKLRRTSKWYNSLARISPSVYIGARTRYYDLRERRNFRTQFRDFDPERSERFA